MSNRDKRFRTGISEASVVKTYALSKYIVKEYYRETYLPSIITWGLIGLIAVGMMIYSIFCNGPVFAYVAIASLCLLVVLWYAFKWWKERRAALAKAEAYIENTIDLDEYGLVLTHDGVQTKRIPWLMIPKMISYRSLFALKISSKQHLILPKEIFTVEERYWLEVEVATAVKRRKKILARNAKNK